MGRQGGGGGGHRSMSATDKQRAFLQSVATEKLPTVKYSLFHGGCEVSLRDDAGNTALHIAVSKRSTALVSKLLAAAQSLVLRTQDKDGDTALHVAVMTAINDHQSQSLLYPISKRVSGAM